MGKKLQRVIVWIAFALAVLVGLRVYSDYRFLQAHQRAIELLGEP
jgi:hypothetical protein